MNDKLVKLRKTVLTEGGMFGYEIISYEDITTIIYFEYENNERVNKQTFDITSGYDLQVFEEAIRLRKQED